MIKPDAWTLRQEALTKLGGRCVCTCGCRESNLRLIQIDHITGGGNGERSKNRGNKFYIELKTKPVDELLQKYQLLCVTCHWLKSQFGVCNHHGCPETQEPRQPPEVVSDPYAYRHGPWPEQSPVATAQEPVSESLWHRVFRR
jgi:hypothetical protein